MLKIHKYEVLIQDYPVIWTYEGAQVLTVQTQFGDPYLWVLCDPNKPPVKRRFRLAGTEYPIEEDENMLHYCGTFQLAEGECVFHLFEII